MYINIFFFFNDTPTTEIYTVYNTLSLHDALPILPRRSACCAWTIPTSGRSAGTAARSEEHTSELQSLYTISYAVFCLKKKIAENSCQLFTSLRIESVGLGGVIPCDFVQLIRRHKHFLNIVFFFKYPAPTDIYTVYNTLSLHDALPICTCRVTREWLPTRILKALLSGLGSEAASPDRKSTRLNSSHCTPSRMPSSARNKKTTPKTTNSKPALSTKKQNTASK